MHIDISLIIKQNIQFVENHVEANEKFLVYLTYKRLWLLYSYHIVTRSTQDGVRRRRDPDVAKPSGAQCFHSLFLSSLLYPAVLLRRCSKFLHSTSPFSFADFGALRSDRISPRDINAHWVAAITVFALSRCALNYCDQTNITFLYMVGIVGPEGVTKTIRSRLLSFARD